MNPRILAILAFLIALLAVIYALMNGGTTTGPTDAGPAPIDAGPAPVDAGPAPSAPDAGPVDSGTSPPSNNPECDACVYQHDFSGDFSFRTDASNTPAIAYPWNFEKLEIRWDDGGSLAVLNAVAKTGQATKIKAGSPFLVKIEPEPGSTKGMDDIDPNTAQVNLHFTVAGSGGPVAHKSTEVCVNPNEGSPCDCKYKDENDPSQGVECQ